jgi:TonB family protein
MILLIYILKLVGCSAILTAYYYFFLRNRTFHLYNRYFLLLTLVLSVTLPFVRIPFLDYSVKSELPVFGNYNTVTLPEVVLTQRDASLEFITLPQLLTAVYVLGALFFFFRVFRSLHYLRRISKLYPVISLGNLKLFFTNEPGTPFSFFRWIFWNHNISTDSPEGKQVLQHELYHVREKHSVDLIMVECLIAIFWFNPFLFFVKKELKAIHEFLADKAAANYIGNHEYAELLLLHAISEKKQQLTHSFFQDNIKRRIIMITQNNKTSFAYLRRVMSLPIMFVVCFACSRNIEDESAAVSEVSSEQNTAAVGEETKKEPGVPQDTIRIAPDQLERLLRSKGIKKDSPFDMSFNSAGNFTYMTFDEGTVYAVATTAIQQLKERQSGKPHFEPPKRKDLTYYDQTFTKVEIEADYPGGVGAWMRFLNKTFHYPDEAIEKEIQGTVVVQFIVNKDGSLSEIEAITGPEALKTEALRVVAKSGKWLPAMQNGVPVKSYKKQPITFRLQSE